jgi:hypothetical protein
MTTAHTFRLQDFTYRELLPCVVLTRNSRQDGTASHLSPRVATTVFGGAVSHRSKEQLGNFGTCRGEMLDK